MIAVARKGPDPCVVVPVRIGEVARADAQSRSDGFVGTFALGPQCSIRQLAEVGVTCRVSLDAHPCPLQCLDLRPMQHLEQAERMVAGLANDWSRPRQPVVRKR